MRAFRFRFEAVLKQRKLLLEQAQTALAAQKEICTKQEEVLLALEEQLQKTGAEGPQVGSPLDLRREALRQRFRADLRAQIEAQKAQLLREEERLELLLKQLREAHREFRAMEVLEERDREAWRTEFRRAEQKEADEQNNQRR